MLSISMSIELDGCYSWFLLGIWGMVLVYPFTRTRDEQFVYNRCVPRHQFKVLLNSRVLNCALQNGVANADYS